MIDGALTALWAKAAGGKQREPTFHPLICHLIDVALVARAMWRDVLTPAARQRLADSLAVDEMSAERWVAFWAGLHDLGKASPAFARQDERAWQIVKQSGLPCPRLTLTKAPHGIVTACSLPAALRSAGLDLSDEVADRIATVLGGHHGIFPRSDEIERVAYDRDAVGNVAWERARAELARVLADMCDVGSAAPPRQIDNPSAMFLAGLVSVADWIGSNVDFFPHQVRGGSPVGPIDPDDYARRVAPKATEALDRLGWLGWTPPATARPFHELFPRIPAPNPLQEHIVALAPALDAPALVVVEAPMGEGKTEAALYLVDRWSATAGQRGCYVALPTQATSNQMFGRVRDFLAERYPDDLINLQLLHGHAALSAEFAALRANGRRFGDGERLFEPNGVGADAGPDQQHGSVAAAEWFTYRKRGLLAPFGVGTVDQALLAVLQTRHVFVRLFGLAAKTVVIDEVHAYDTYMTTLLERLLEWLGALGSSVVLLSATLPHARRLALASAYARGLGRPPVMEDGLPERPYPRLTWVTPMTADATGVAIGPDRARSVKLAWADGAIPDESEPFPLAERLRAALERGGCAVVICNTVGRAQRMYRALERYFPGLADDGEPTLDLLHARFLFRDREARERRALDRFGKPGHGRRPGRAVLVATQIVEQSLDLDFDLMVSDLAPADLVLQRIGRLHRHVRGRPAGLGQPTIWLLSPEVDPDGAPRFDDGTAAVYDRHVLLRSWLTLRDRATIQVPDDVEPIVEDVYDDARACPAEVSPALRALWTESRGALDATQAEYRRQADRFALVPPGYRDDILEVFNQDLDEDDPTLHPALRAQTRLADPSAAVALLEPNERGQASTSGAPSIEQAKWLLERSLTISHRGLTPLLWTDAAAAPTSWQRSALLRHHRLIVLDDHGVADVGPYRLQLDPGLGLVVTRRDKEDT